MTWDLFLSLAALIAWWHLSRWLSRAIVIIIFTKGLKTYVHKQKK